MIVSSATAMVRIDPPTQRRRVRDSRAVGMVTPRVYLHRSDGQARIGPF